MRKAAVMIGFGAFFLTMALLMRFYAYPHLAVIPKDTNTRQLVSDDHAKYFDAATVSPKEGKIVTTANVVADQDATKKAAKETGKDVVVVNMWQTTVAPGAKDKQGKTPPPIDGFTQKVAVDRSTGAAVNWSGNTIDGKQTDITGQILKFPFQTSKDGSYRYWDSTLHKALPVTFDGEEKINGLQTYRFVQTVPKTKFMTMDVPTEIFGKPAGGVVADRYYANKRTLWINPETGVMMKLQEEQKQTLEIPNASPVNAMTTTSTMTPQTTADNVSEYKTKASQLKILRLWAPLVLALIGLASLLLGLLVSARAGRVRARHAAEDEPEAVVGPDPRGHHVFQEARREDDTVIMRGEGSHRPDEGPRR